MIDLGTIKPGSTIRIPWSSFDKDDGSSVTCTNFLAADILVYKDGGTTERASTAGYTATTDFDGKTGKHLVVIDLADNTTAGFWAAGSEYLVAIDAVTVDGVTTGGWVGRFRIGYPSAVLDTTIATLASQTSFTLTVGPAEDDALNGFWAVIHDVASAVQCSRVLVLDYTGSTKTVTLAAGATFVAAAGDNFSVVDMAPLQPTTTGRTLDVSGGGEAGVDWANVGSPTTVVGLSGTTIKTATDVETDTADIQSRLPAALTAGGNIKADALALSGDTTAADNAEAFFDGTGYAGTNNVIPTVTTLTNLPPIPANWLTAAGTAADFATEIRTAINGGDYALDTDANGRVRIVDGTGAGELDTLSGTVLLRAATQASIDAIEADTSELQTDWANGGRLDLLIDAILADTGTDGVVLAAAGLQTDAVEEIRNAITGGAYAFSTDANGRVRVVDGTAAGELDTSSGRVQLTEAQIDQIVDEVWDELREDHITNGTFGQGVENVMGNVIGSVGSVQGSLSLSAHLGVYRVGDTVTFSTIHTEDTGTPVGATEVSYEVYEDDNTTPVASGFMTVEPVTGYYLKKLTLSSPTYSDGKNYTIRLYRSGSGLGTAEIRTFQTSPLSTLTASDVWVAATRTLTALDEDATTLDLDATIRAAVGLVSADLDAQLDKLDTIDDFLDTEIATILSRIGVPASSLAADIAALNDLSAAEVNAEVDTALADVGLTTTVTGRIDAAVSTRATPAQVNAEVLDVLNVDTFAQPTGVPSPTATLAEKIGRLHQALISELTITGTAKTFFTHGGAALWKKTMADDGTTYSETDALAP